MPETRPRPPSGRSYPLHFLAVIALILLVILTAPKAEDPIGVTLTILGYVAELVGLVMAMTGLYQTWRENAPPQRPLFPTLTGVFERLRGRTLVTAQGASTGVISASDTAITAGVVGLTDVGTVQEQLAALRERLKTVGAAERSKRHATESTLDGIPLAVKGLALTSLGVLLQALGRGLSS